MLRFRQPALTKMLGEVEAMVGATSFERTGRGTFPTPAGAILCRDADRMQAALERRRASSP